MNYLNNPTEAPRRSTGISVLKFAAAMALLTCGYRLGYCTDPDWDKDGMPNDVETKFQIDPHNGDTDRDGRQDSKDPYPRDRSIHSSGSDTYTICLTSDNGKEICFHPTNILMIDKIKDENLYEVIYWDNGVEAINVQENLTRFEERMIRIGYPHFYRVNRQDLPNMLHAECLSDDTLYMSQEENIWCRVAKGKLRTVKLRVDYRDCRKR